MQRVANFPVARDPGTTARVSYRTANNTSACTKLGLHRTRLMNGVLRARSRFALGAGIDYDNYRSYRHVKTYRGRLFNRVQPTWSADSAVALRSASPRNTVLFSLAIRAVVLVLP